MIRENGFSLLEALLGVLLALVVAAVVLALASPARDAVITQPEAADLQQRLRTASDALYKDLLMAGAGAYLGPQIGPLVYFFAPILPFRAGLKNPDPPGVARTDTVTVFYVPSTSAQTSLAAVGPSAAAASVDVSAGAGCPPSVAACGFQAGMNALIFDTGGLRDTFSVPAVLGATVSLQANTSSLTFADYPAGTAIAQVVTVMYSLKPDAASQSFQLVRTDGVSPEVPVVDHLVGLTFEYWGDPRPPMLTGKPLNDPSGPWTTYGPRPPLPGTQGPTQGYPAGENCVFAIDPSTGSHVPRLPVLAASPETGLAPLAKSQLTDGPWCPDDTNPNRWDADLLRIRSVAVTLRIQTPNPALRGPAGPLFTNGGTSRNLKWWLPDVQSTLHVMPRNLNVKALNGW